MKKLLALALVMVLALSLAACSVSTGDKDTPSSTPSGGDNTNPPANSGTPSGNDTTPTPSGTTEPSGELTLAALKAAAKNAGFVTDDSVASTNNFEGTLTKPVAGFCIEVTKPDGSKSLAIRVNEQASAEEVKTFADYILGQQFNNDVVYTSGKFYVHFVGPDDQNMWPGLLAAFATVGWINNAPSGDGGNTEPSGNTPDPNGNNESSDGEFTFSFNKTKYDIGEEIVVTITGITAKMETDGYQAVLYKVGSDDYVYYHRVEADRNTYDFQWTKESGMYEIRLTGRDNNVVHARSAPFPVG
jgi:hypothetical protein